MKKKVLVVDIGGTHVKLMISRSETRKFDSGMKFAPKQLAQEIKEALLVSGLSTVTTAVAR